MATSMRGEEQSYSGDMNGMMDDQQQQRGFDDSDEFDPAALLSQPLFNDSQGELNVSQNDLRFPAQDQDDMMSNHSSTSSLPPQQSQALLMQQRQQLQALQQQQQQQQQQAGFQQQNQQVPQQQNQFGNFGNQQQAQMQNQNHFTSFNQPDSQQGNSSFSMNDSQNFQQLQFGNQPQQQIDVGQNMMQQQQQQPQPQQMDNQSMMSQQQSAHQQGFQNQQGFGNMQGNMNARMNSGSEFTRAPPGRSASMPIQRMNVSSMGNSEFMMQQQQQTLQAMQGTFQNGMFMQQQQQRQQRQNSMDTSQTSHSSMQMNPNMGVMQQQQQQAMDGSFSSLPPMMAQTSPMVTQRNSLPMSPNGMQQGQMQGQGNMLPNQIQVPMGELAGFNQMSALAAGAQGQQQGGQQGADGKEPTVNEAMEKLCESMRRSAMSRSLVKQLSGRNMPQRGNLSRQGSARLTKQLSGRNLARANSGRSIQRTHSGRAAMDNAPNMPVRRVAHDPKHRIQQLANGAGHSRGVLRHKSSGALIGMRRSAFQNQQQQQDFNPNGPGGGL